VEELIRNLLDSLGFFFERLNWLSIVDLALVTLIFFGILLLLRDTQAVVVLRGVLVIVVLVGLLNSLEVLPAFSWLVRTTLPALVLAVPVIFAWDEQASYCATRKPFRKSKLPSGPWLQRQPVFPTGVMGP
jgi:DNA integrity scanning protein DisA with diadenylate cyclase activity